MTWGIIRYTSLSHFFLNGHPTWNWRRFYVDIMSIRRRLNFGKFPRIFTYLFDVILLIEKFTSLQRIFFDVISMAEKSTLFSHFFFDVISMVEKSTLFPLTLFDIISMGKNSAALVNLQANENTPGGFPLLATLKSWFLQDCFS